MYRKRMSVYLARIEKSKKNGSTTPIPVHASNLMLKKVSCTHSRARLVVLFGGIGAVNSVPLCQFRLSVIVVFGIPPPLHFFSLARVPRARNTLFNFVVLQHSSRHVMPPHPPTHS